MLEKMLCMTNETIGNRVAVVIRWNGLGLEEGAGRLLVYHVKFNSNEWSVGVGISN